MSFGLYDLKKSFLREAKLVAASAMSMVCADKIKQAFQGLSKKQFYVLKEFVDRSYGRQKNRSQVMFALDDREILVTLMMPHEEGQDVEGAGNRSPIMVAEDNADILQSLDPRFVLSVFALDKQTLELLKAEWRQKNLVSKTKPESGLILAVA